MSPKKPKRRAGFEEAQTPFGAPAQVFAVHSAYDSHCAFTGIDLGNEIARDPAGQLLYLDGSADAGAWITASREAIAAYEQGHIALGQRFEFLVALDRIDPEFLERLNPIGRLTLPTDPQFLPDSALLKVHRDKFAAGFID